MPEYELRTHRSLVHTNQTQNPFQSKKKHGLKISLIDQMGDKCKTNEQNY